MGSFQQHVGLEHLPIRRFYKIDEIKQGSLKLSFIKVMSCFYNCNGYVEQQQIRCLLVIEYFSR